MSDKQNPNVSKLCRPTVLCGLSISCELDKSATSELQANKQNTTQLYLVVYDFMYTKEQPDTENDTLFNINPPCSHEDYMNMTSGNLFDGLDSNEFETEDVTGYNLIKQLSSYYKTFIPGESDEVFLPPTVAVKKTHTGPKVLHDAFDSKNTGFTTNNYQITSNQNNIENAEVSISDHIAEVMFFCCCCL